MIELIFKYIYYFLYLKLLVQVRIDHLNQIK